MGGREGWEEGREGRKREQGCEEERRKGKVGGREGGRKGKGWEDYIDRHCYVILSIESAQHNLTGMCNTSHFTLSTHQTHHTLTPVLPQHGWSPSIP